MVYQYLFDLIYLQKVYGIRLEIHLETIFLNYLRTISKKIGLAVAKTNEKNIKKTKETYKNQIRYGKIH